MDLPRAGTRHVPIEPDSTGSDDSDGYMSADYASVASSIPNYIYQNGRRYHSTSADKYLLPNDEREQERLDFVHHVFRLTLGGGLCYTRPDNPQRILDVGTGTGIWAMDIAEEFPLAEVIGTDLTPIQPSWAPPNVQFMVDDALLEWTLPESSFDFIHLRTMGGSIPDWPALLKQCYKRLKPGGRIEISDIRPRFCCDDDSLPQGSRTAYWVDEFHRTSEGVGYQFDFFPHVAEWMGEAGFEEIEVVDSVVPVGTWPKDRTLKARGRYFMAQFLGHALETYSGALFVRVGGWKHEDMIALINDVSREIRTNKMHIYTHFSFAVAKKPASE